MAHSYVERFNHFAYSDITINVGDKSYLGHRVFLMRIPYLAELFSENVGPITLEGVDNNYAEMLMKWAYNEPLPSLSARELIVLYKATQKFNCTAFLDDIREKLVVIVSKHTGAERMELICYGISIGHPFPTSASDFCKESLLYLSYDNLLLLEPLLDKEFWCIVFSWLGFHPDTSEEQRKNLFDRITIFPTITIDRLRRLNSYYSMPSVVTKDFVHKLVAHYGLNSEESIWNVRNGTAKYEEHPLEYGDVIVKLAPQEVVTKKRHLPFGKDVTFKRPKPPSSWQHDKIVRVITTEDHKSSGVTFPDIITLETISHLPQHQNEA